MEGKSVEITYDTLYDLLKRERDRSELQKLEPTFYDELVSFIKQNSSTDDVSGRQNDNIRKILKELYERREKKIMNMALDMSRTKSMLVDTSSLLREEKVLFDSVVGLLDHFRKNTISSVIDGKQPLLNMHELKINDPKGDFKSATELEKEDKLVRFIQAVPKFVGPELEEYGPFQEEDITKLPSQVAKLLISKGRVEEIKEN